jgi:purine-binding chemotaxis protein CheW
MSGQIADEIKTDSHENAQQPARLEKYLTFNLDKGVYGLEILRVKEIIGLMKITKVPRSPDYVRGIINLRGQVIPVVDLRVKFGIEKQEDTELSCIIVVQIAARNKVVTAGVLVDSVAEVLDIENGKIEEAPSFGEGNRSEFIEGIGKLGEKVIIILDIEKTIDICELMDAVA